jgi:hypothetical protein
MQPFFNHGANNWFQLQTLPTKSYSCGFCGDKVSSEKGYKIGNNADGSGSQIGAIQICPNCKGPTFFTPSNEQIPSSSVGRSVSHVPDELNKLYEEARRCTTNNCQTAAVLVCRKILMNIAVQVGASEGESFITYVNFLSDKGYIPPNGKHWVDHVRKKGNEANHEIRLMDAKDASDLLIFIEMLLKFIYEFPNMIPKESS